jgi:hypothetical protein
MMDSIICRERSLASSLMCEENTKNLPVVVFVYYHHYKEIFTLYG